MHGWTRYNRTAPVACIAPIAVRIEGIVTIPEHCAAVQQNRVHGSAEGPFANASDALPTVASSRIAVDASNCGLQLLSQSPNRKQ